MKILFLDESGDHNLTSPDPQYPLFVLAGCVMSEDYYNRTFEGRLTTFKQEMFGNKNIVLHYIDYTRNQNGFDSMSDKPFREKFYDGLNKIIKDTEFTLISSIVDKLKHKAKYGSLAIDPYTLSLEIIIERFVKLLEDTKEKGIVIAESRGQQLDNELNLAFLDLKIRGTKYLRPKEIVDKIEAFNIRKKEENIPGLQLVDSLVTPIGRRYCQRKNHYIDYGVIKSKFRKIECGKYRGYGLIIVPK